MAHIPLLTIARWLFLAGCLSLVACAESTLTGAIESVGQLRETEGATSEKAKDEDDIGGFDIDRLPQYRVALIPIPILLG